MMLFLGMITGGILHAENLPTIKDVTLNGDELSWGAIEGAQGYNIYLDYRYYVTVTEGTSYTLVEPGDYVVVWFDAEGNFSPNGGLDENGEYIVPIEYDGEGAQNVRYNYSYYTLQVYTTCTDVGPGETCVARCPSNYVDDFYGTIYPRYISGGACSTSDIVEADAFIDDRAYRCTVPTFSGEVVAQAVCVVR